MKRENYLIAGSDGYSTVRHKWNAAIRAVEAHVREVASVQGTTYRLVASTSKKDDDSGTYCNGTRVWESADKSRQITFTVTREIPT